MENAPAIEIRDLKNQFGDHVIHQDLNLTIERGEILGIVGGSGCGKTTLLRAILLLLRPTAGSIKVFGQEILKGGAQADLIRKKWGVLFQEGALFSSLTVLENVCFPLREFTQLDKSLIEEIALLKISLSQFPLESVHKYPSELSGGMLKRAALARAIALDPELLFLDEPTAGLDPESAGALDKLIADLQLLLGLTIVVVTHDLDTLWQVTNRVAFLGNKKVIEVAPISELIHSSDPQIQAYFSGPRARTAQAQAINKNSEKVQEDGNES